MGFVTRILVLFLAIIIGISMMKYRERLVNLFGKNYYAEKYLGNGGSYNFWQLLGILVILGALIYLFS